MMKTPIFVVEENPVLRETLVQLLRARDFRTRSFATDDQFFDKLPGDAFACVITALRRPGFEDLELVRLLRDYRGEAWSIIVTTDHADLFSAVELMKAGVADLIEKPVDPERLLKSVTLCMDRLLRIKPALEQRASINGRLAQLTARERQVFDALTIGRSNKEIAVELDISPRTVEIFRSRVMEKMGASNLPLLVRMSLGQL